MTCKWKRKLNNVLIIMALIIITLIVLFGLKNQIMSSHDDQIDAFHPKLIWKLFNVKFKRRMKKNVYEKIIFFNFFLHCLLKVLKNI